MGINSSNKIIFFFKVHISHNLKWANWGKLYLTMQLTGGDILIVGAAYSAICVWDFIHVCVCEWRWRMSLRLKLLKLRVKGWGSIVLDDAWGTNSLIWEEIISYIEIFAGELKITVFIYLFFIFITWLTSSIFLTLDIMCSMCKVLYDRSPKKHLERSYGHFRYTALITR